MDRFIAIFKCRLCGTIYSSTAKPVDGEEAYTETMDLVIGDKPDYSAGPFFYEIHHCEGSYAGSYGFGDFQGFRLLKEPE